jgi:DNA-binding NarL/FixJ family response regulator
VWPPDQAGTAAEAIEAARTYRPDLVIMDIRLPDDSGIEATREIPAENPAIRVIMLTNRRRHRGRGGEPAAPHGQLNDQARG